VHSLLGDLCLVTCLVPAASCLEMAQRYFTRGSAFAQLSRTRLSLPPRLTSVRSD